MVEFLLVVWRNAEIGAADSKLPQISPFADIYFAS